MCGLWEWFCGSGFVVFVVVVLPIVCVFDRRLIDGWLGGWLVHVVGACGWCMWLVHVVGACGCLVGS